MSEEMQYSHYEIREFVLSKMREHGMQPVPRDEYLKIDGQLHRYQIEGHKNGSKNGAYVIFDNKVPACFIQNWSIPDAIFKFNMKGNSERVQYSEADIKKMQEEYEKRKAQELKRQTEAITLLRGYFNNAFDGEIYHEYLSKKQVKAHGVRLDNMSKRLLIPMYNIEGELVNIQAISEDGTKRFQPSAPKIGNFFAIGLDKVKDSPNTPILIGEGYATMAKIYELTGSACVAAMDCGNIRSVAEAIHSKFPHCKIIITADNDIRTQIKLGRNPGLEAAVSAVNLKLAVGYVFPPFNRENPEGTDWDDYAIIFGDNAAREALVEGESGLKQFFMTEEQRNEYLITLKLCSHLGFLDPEIKLPPQDYIGGLFPCGYLSVIVAPPGTGKTIFMQKAVSDLSRGGMFFDGFVENEPVRKSLIFAGEAGYELLLRRSASFKWPINPKNVVVADQYTYETNNYSLMLDDETGWNNVTMIINKINPHIVFFDTLVSFHEKDANKATEMKPIFRSLAKVAKEKNIAIVLNHHTRKRSAKDRAFLLDQDDAMGTSALNQLVALLIGIEHIDDKTLQVRPLKSWNKYFQPFTYSISEDLYGHSVIETNLYPEDSGNSRYAVLNYLIDNFQRGEWFSASQIVLSEIECEVSERLLRKIITELVRSGKLDKQGTTKDVLYSIPQV